MRLLLQRHHSTIEGTFGTLWAEAFDRPLFTAEPPWRNNLRGMSCIPTGDYTLVRRYSPKFKKDLWEVVDVPQRTAILFHIGNYAGDTERSLRTDTDGCICLGMDIGKLKHGGRDQEAVLASGAAMEYFHRTLGKGTHLLTVVEFPQ